MPSERAKREALVRARSASAASAASTSSAKKSGADRGAPNPAALYVIGILIAGLGVAALAMLYARGMAGEPLDGALPFVSDGTGALATPGVLFLIAMVPLFIAELMRRARWEVRARSFVRGGSVGVVITPTPVWGVLLWLAVAVVAWIVLVPVALSGEAERSATDAAASEFRTLIAVYGFVAAAIVGIIALSLLKRVTYARLAARFGPAPQGGRTVWALMTVQWRLDSWFAALGAGLLGCIPLLVVVPADETVDVTALAWVIGLGVFGILAGVVLALNAWRSGEPYGAAESIA